MPIASFPNHLSNGPGNPPDADQLNENWQALADAHNLSIARYVPNVGVPGQLVVCDAAGNPQLTVMSGDAAISAAGVVDVDFSSVEASAGITGGGVTRRGKSIIATEEGRSGTSYDTLATPDQVASVVMPADGLIAVAFEGLWKSSVAGAGRAAIFLGANQMKVNREGGAAPITQAAAFDLDSGANTYNPLVSSPGGLVGTDADVAHTGDVTTGQAIATYGAAAQGSLWVELGGARQGLPADSVSGGACLLFAAAGTYTVSIQFKATSGSVTAKERKLWVWTMTF